MNKKDNDYIVFLLGTDDFEISKLIRMEAREFNAIDRMYYKCCYIASKFEEYDKVNYNTKISQYDSFTRFLTDYDKELKDYIFEDKMFNIKENE